MQERLQKILSGAGIASRRKSEELILQGLVRVNNKIAKLGDKADPIKDNITYKGSPVRVETKREYIIFNKPAGCITTKGDPKKRRDIYHYLPKYFNHLNPVGRLDKDTTGLLLLTNDGDLHNKLIHPKQKVPKKYLIKVPVNSKREQLEKLAAGVKLEDGLTLPAKLEIMDENKEELFFNLTITEGRNRQIRRMCESVGLNLLHLKRVEIGNIKLGRLALGKFRKLTYKELERLLKK